MKFGREFSHIVATEPDPLLRNDFLAYKRLKQRLRVLRLGAARSAAAAAAATAAAADDDDAFARDLREEVDKVGARFAREVLKITGDFWRLERNPTRGAAAVARVRVVLLEDVMGYPPEMSREEEALFRRARALRRFAELNTIATWKIVKKHAKISVGASTLGRAPARANVEVNVKAVLDGCPVAHRSFFSVVDELCRRAALHDRCAGLCGLDSPAVPPEYTCPVCLDLLFRPMALPCGHRFCRHCVESVRRFVPREPGDDGPERGAPRCPVCRLRGTPFAAKEMKALGRFLSRTYLRDWGRRKLEMAAATSQNLSTRVLG